MIRRGCLRAITLAGLLLASAGAAAQTPSDPLRMVFFPFPPFNYTTEQGDVRGDLVDLFRRMTNHLGVAADIREFPVARARAMIIAGEADVLLTNNSAAELRGHILSSPQPIDELVTQAFTLAPTLVVQSQDDLRGRTVILQQRFAYGGIRQFIENPANRVALTGEPPDSASGLRMLLARRGEIYIQYRNKFQEAVDEIKPTATIHAHTLSVIPIYINVSQRHPQAQALLDRLVAAHAVVSAASQRQPQPRSDIDPGLRGDGRRIGYGS